MKQIQANGRSVFSRRVGRGFTLLEALITLAIFALGLLGLLGLQTRAVKLNQDSMSRSLAAQYAYSMLDELRSNCEKARNGITKDYMLKTLVAATIPARLADTGNSEEKKSLGRWASQLVQELPGSQVQICRLNTAGIGAGGTLAGGCSDDAGDYFMVRVDWVASEDATTGLGSADEVAKNAARDATLSIKALAYLPEGSPGCK